MLPSELLSLFPKYNAGKVARGDQSDEPDTTHHFLWRQDLHGPLSATEDLGDFLLSKEDYPVPPHKVHPRFWLLPRFLHGHTLFRLPLSEDNNIRPSYKYEVLPVQKFHCHLIFLSFLLSDIFSPDHTPAA